LVDFLLIDNTTRRNRCDWNRLFPPTNLSAFQDAGFNRFGGTKASCTIGKTGVTVSPVETGKPYCCPSPW